MTLGELLVVVLITVLCLSCFYFSNPLLYTSGPTELMFFAARSLAEEGRLAGSWIYEISSDIHSHAVETNSTLWQDVFVLL